MAAQISPEAGFATERPRLQRLAYRMLGSVEEAEDAIQECWIRLQRSDVSEIDELPRWLTAVTARICLDLLRARRVRRTHIAETPEEHNSEPRDARMDPEQEAVLADEVGLAVLVLMRDLLPAERVAFVLHDIFDMPFAEIAPIVGRSADAARQLASRGRRRVRGAPLPGNEEFRAQQAIVDAYLAAAQTRDLPALLHVLDPEVVLDVDAHISPAGEPEQVRGSGAVAQRAIGFAERAQLAEAAFIAGAWGIIVAPDGKLAGILLLTIDKGRITEMDLVADPDRLRAMQMNTGSIH